MIVESPRKRPRREDSPSQQAQRIPESPVGAKRNGQSHENGRLATASPKPLSQHGENMIDMSNSAQLTAGNSQEVLPHKPNLSIRKAGFPSQMHKAQKQNQSVGETRGPDAITNQTAHSQQQMREQISGYQYQGPGYPQSYRVPSPQTQYNMQGGPPPHGQYAPANGDPRAMSHVPRPTSMASQYSAGRPRLVQRPDMPVNGQVNPYNNLPASPYQNGYRPGAVGYQSTGNGYARPSVSLEAIKKLSEVYPHLPDDFLRKAMLQARGNLQDAKALIADNRVKLEVERPMQSQQPMPQQYGQMMNGYPQQQPFANGYYTGGRALPVSTKREIKAPNLSIREKQALRTAQTYTGQWQPNHQARYDSPYGQPTQEQMYYMQQQQRQMQMQNQKKHVPAVYEAPKLRTRSVKKGPKIDIGSDESEEEAAIDLESEEEMNASESDSDIDQPIKQEAVPYLDFDRIALESRVLHFFNTAGTTKELADLASCSEEVARQIIDARPFETLEQVQQVDQPTNGKRPSRTRKTTGLKAVEVALVAMEGFEAIDNLVERCEEYGRIVKEAIAKWGIETAAKDSEDGALAVTKVDIKSEDTADETGIKYLSGQPPLLPDAVRLKDYQLFGVNWLHLLYQKKLSGILADEMGLGKTCQVISFLGLLLERDLAGPHLIVVPASTLENWLREISRFCPSLKVEAYYGSQRERNEFRDQFEGEKRDFNIMVTTYQLATGAKDDRTFLRRQHFDVCVYDEGHNLKNSSSSRYKYLMALKANFRVLLTGTPLQNNLKELISLLSFVLPRVFAGNIDRLDEIFKIKSFSDTDSLESALLSQERIKRAKAMMTPFILRRFKKDVLDDLPEKKYRIDYLELNEAQKQIYNEQLAATKEALQDKEDPDTLTKDSKSAANVMMQLRKCSNHPMLFRRQYTDAILKKMAKAVLTEETFKDSQEQYVIEDMSVMTDYELNRFCLQWPSIAQYALEQDCWMDACKVAHLQKILPEMKKNGDRILLFSQFTQTLDILEDCMDTMGITYFRLDGSTNVSARQDLIDQFHEETDITVFLLSTKAGGFGINLACANVVIIYDSSFNPHDDKQAEDRAHRVGQKREVQIIRLITKNTIEEHIARLANTKLTLDSSVSGDPDAESKAIEEQGEKRVAQSLISQLKEQ